jgi:hypothetical protein
MEIRGKQGVRILLQFGTFNAIDVFQRGLYGLSCRIYKKLRVNGSNPKRIDGKIAFVSNSEKYTSSCSEDQPLDYPVAAEYSRCSIPHNLCNWRCRPKTFLRKPPKPVKTKFFTHTFQIEQQGDLIPLECGVVFDIHVPVDLNTTDIDQENCMYIDFELFFSSDHGKETTVFQKSSQRRVYKLNLDKLPDSIGVPQYAPIVFDEIFCSAIDILITPFCTDVLVQKGTAELLSIPSFNSLGSINRSSSWNWTSLIAMSQPFVEDPMESDVLMDVQPIWGINDLFELQMKSIIKTIAALTGISDSNTEGNWWSQIAMHCELEGGDGTEFLQNPDANELLKAVEDHRLEFKNANEYVLAFEVLGQLSLQITETWIQQFHSRHFCLLPQLRYDHRISKIQSHMNFIMTRGIDEFCRESTEVIATQLQMNSKRTLIGHWPCSRAPLYLFGIDTDSFRELPISGPPSKRSLSWTSPQNSKGVHLFIFVHGFLGNAYDLRRYRNQLLHYLNELGLVDVHHSYLISTFNESDTLSHLSALGNNLANEIWQHIFEYNLETSLEKISFICHSMGGLIARMAIRHENLNSFKALFHSYTSFASPHCSLLLHSHLVLDPCNLCSLVIGIMQNIYKSDSLEQLYLHDHQDKRECLLYRLSQDTNMKYFDHVNLFASQQDSYVHLESALVTPLQSFKDYSKHDAENKAVYREMVRNFEANCRKINRFEVWFQEFEVAKKQWPLKDPLGRNAHIAILEEVQFLELAVICTRMHI